jgi:hypothetical protein
MGSHERGERASRRRSPAAMKSGPRRRALATGLVLAALLRAAGPAAAKPDESETWDWTGVPQVVAVGDVHGNLDKLIELLSAAALIGEERHWTGGESHLVVAGDFLDRGLDDRPLMDLLRQLEQESAAAGGRVHVLLGNHEVMTLFRDLRYVNPASYRHFAAEESKADRRAAALSLATLRRSGRGSHRLRTFNKAFPPGYFARLRSFDLDGEYGRWLVELPAIVKINGVAYLHGGLHDEIAALGVVGINRRVGEQIRRYLEARQVLESEGVISPVMDYAQVDVAARRAAEARRGDRALRRRQAAKKLLAAAADPILGSEGPLWYRGSAMQDERLERDILDRSLELLEARALVVAHSPTANQQITSRFHGRLFRIDHNIGGSDAALALVAEQGELLVLDPSSGTRTEPVRELPLGQPGASRAAELPDEELQRFLSESPIIASRTLGRGSTQPQLLVLEDDGEVRRGIFKTVASETGTDRFQHEVAAYRLDRLLGLDMVPVTVLRSVDGRDGSLQAWVDGALDQEAAEGYNLEFFETESRASQLDLGRIFDALIGNTGRKPADILGLVRKNKVMLIDHSQAFSISAELPAEFSRLGSIPAPLAEAIAELDRETIDRHLGELISSDQIEALLERRDRILEKPVAAATISP